MSADPNQTTSLNVSLPEALKTFVEDQVSRRGYASASEYVRELIRDAQTRRGEEELEAKLLEGLASGDPIRVTPAFWERLRGRVEAAVKKKARGGA